MVDSGYNWIMKLVLGLVVASVILNASWRDLSVRGGIKSPSVPLYERGKPSHLPPLAGDHPLTHLPPLAGGTKGGGKEVR